jgi:uncharacterized protein (TIGR00266 family)
MMQHKIVGTTMPVLEFLLGAGEAVVGESGRMSWMSPSITMATSTAFTGGGGGLLSKVKRMAGGGTLFASSFTSSAADGLVAFATTVPGEILPVSVAPGSGYMVHRHGFLASTPGIELSAGFQQSLGSGLFGGEGFILQRLAGQAEVWVQLQGEVVTYDLQAGQSMLVHPAHVGMFTDGMSFTITTVKGLKNKFFGNEFFLCQLTGPGKLWLQSLTLPGLAADLIPYLPEPNGGGSGFSFGS